MSSNGRSYYMQPQSLAPQGIDRNDPLVLSLHNGYKKNGDVTNVMARLATYWHSYFSKQSKENPRKSNGHRTTIYRQDGRD